MRKGNILMIILAVVGIVAVSVGGYFWWQNQQQKTSGQLPSLSQLNASNNFLSPSKMPDTSVTLDAETDPVKRHQKFSQRLDLELVQAKYTSLTGTNLELKIPSSFSVTTKINSQTPVGQNLLAVTDKESDLFWQVWSCDYEYNRAPSVQKSMDESFCKDLLSHYSQEQLDGYQGLRIQHNFFVDEIRTPATPQEWVLDNVMYQGTKLRDLPQQEVSRGVNRIIHGFSYLAIGVACCGGYEMNYFTQYQDTKGNKILLKFGTNDWDGAYPIDMTTDQYNIVLDKILATLRKNE